MEFWQGELSKQDEISEKSLDQSFHLMMKKLSHRDRDDLPRFVPLSFWCVPKFAIYYNK